MYDDEYFISQFGGAQDQDKLGQKLSWSSATKKLKFKDAGQGSPEIDMAVADRGDHPELFKGESGNWKCYLLSVAGAASAGIAGWVDTGTAKVYFYGYKQGEDPYDSSFPDLPSSDGKRYSVYRITIGESSDSINPFVKGNVIRRGWSWSNGNTQLQPMSFAVLENESHYGLPLIQIDRGSNDGDLGVRPLYSGQWPGDWPPIVWSVSWREKSTSKIIKSVMISQATNPMAPWVVGSISSVLPGQVIDPLETPGVFVAEYP